MSIENNSIIAFAPVSSSNPRSLKEQEVPAVHGTQIGSLIGELVDTFMYPGSEGMVHSRIEYNRVVDINAYIENNKYNPKYKKSNELLYSIDLLDFAMLALNFERKQSQRGAYKVMVIERAKESTKNAFN